MTPKIKNYIIAALFMVLMGYVGLNSRRKDEIASLRSIISTDSSTIVYTKNKWGEEIAKRQVAELDSKTFKETYEKDLTYIKSHLGVNKNDVQGIIAAAFEGHYEGETDSVQVDTVTNTIHHTTETVYTASDSNRWISITATLRPGQFKYRVRTFDSVIFVPHLVSSGFLRKKRLFVSGESFNPYSKITGLSLREVAMTPKHWVVSAGASAGWTDHFTIMPSLHVGYKLFEF